MYFGVCGVVDVGVGEVVGYFWCVVFEVVECVVNLFVGCVGV